MEMKRDYYEDVQLFTSGVIVFWFGVLLLFLTVFPCMAALLEIKNIEIYSDLIYAILIRMSDATRFKRMVFFTALKVGRKRASLKMDFKPVPLYLEIIYQLAYFAIFRKIKERMGFDRMWVAYSGAARMAAFR